MSLKCVLKTGNSATATERNIKQIYAKLSRLCNHRKNLHCNDVLKKGEKIMEETKRNMHKLKSSSTKALR